MPRPGRGRSLRLPHRAVPVFDAAAPDRGARVGGHARDRVQEGVGVRAQRPAPAVPLLRDRIAVRCGRAGQGREAGPLRRCLHRPPRSVPALRECPGEVRPVARRGGVVGPDSDAPMRRSARNPGKRGIGLWPRHALARPSAPVPSLGERRIADVSASACAPDRDASAGGCARNGIEANRVRAADRVQRPCAAVPPLRQHAGVLEPDQHACRGRRAGHRLDGCSWWTWCALKPPIASVPALHDHPAMGRAPDRRAGTSGRAGHGVERAAVGCGERRRRQRPTARLAYLSQGR